MFRLHNPTAGDWYKERIMKENEASLTFAKVAHISGVSIAGQFAHS